MIPNVPPHSSADSPFRRLVVLGILSTIAAVGFMVFLFKKTTEREIMASTVLAQPPSSTESFNTVAAFTLTERSGRSVTRDDLLGTPWIADFVFTRCTGPCPRVSGNMKKLQGRLIGIDAKLVTFSVDPTYDTPAVLAQYADALGADKSRWLFLTGTDAAIHAVSTTSFLLPIERNLSQPVGSSVTHRTVLTVVDKHGVIRGYYDGESDDGVTAAFERVRFLASEQ